MSMIKSLPLSVLNDTRLRRTGLRAGMLLLLSAAGDICAAEQSDEQNSLLRFLENVPDVTQLYTASVALNYVNYRNTRDGCAVSGIAGAAALANLDDEQFQQWSDCLGRIHPLAAVQSRRAGAGLLQFQQLMPELAAERLARKVPGAGSMFRNLPQRLGIDWFEIGESLVFGAPPYVGVLLGYTDGVARAAAISPVLQKAGFSAAQAYGLPVWMRFNDLEVRESAVFPADSLGRIAGDPFGIGHGYGLKLIEKPGVLGGSRSTEITALLAATWVGKFPGILQVAAYRAAAAAVTDAGRYGGVLIQALFHGTRYTPEQLSLMRSGRYASDEQRKTYADELKQRNPAPLDPYQLIVLADRQEGDEELLLLGLVFDDRSGAEYAAEILPQLVTAYTPVEYRTPLPELIAFTASAHVFQGENDAPYVAVLALRHSGDNGGGKLFRIFSNGFRHHDLDMLVTVEPKQP